MAASLIINGNHLLEGVVKVSGSKNGSLPIMAAALLASGESHLHDVPRVNDVHNLCRLMGHLGASTSFTENNILSIKTDHIRSTDICPKVSGLIRASILLLGPLLARLGHARIPLPGGCAIGERPIDQHLRGLMCLGATVIIRDGFVEAVAPKTGLRGGNVPFDCPTVTGTMNIMLAASLATGVTEITNAAMEPEVSDLAACLKGMGCIIKGAGTSEITIYGRKRLKPFKHKVIGDRIESGTLLIAGAMLGNPLIIDGCNYEQQKTLIDALRLAGAQVECGGHSTVKVYRARELKAMNIETGPYPYFPTDLQPQFMTLLALAHGTSTVTENVFETRFGQVAGLSAMGADIVVDDDCKTAAIQGTRGLSGQSVSSTDLRCGASLLLAGLVAEGNTIIESTEHLDRGYDGIEQKLIDVGADIIRIDKDDSGSETSETTSIDSSPPSSSSSIASTP